jgi:hypothetical protein
VWHVSVSWQRLYLPDAELRRVAYETLKGVGDADLGEWDEKGASALHLRRRLSEEEAALVGPVLDVRGTDEARHRAYAVRRWIVMAGMEDFAAREVRGEP